ncbi:MAG TPA: NnrS family protein [Alphaproteobacteria bacterium]
MTSRIALDIREPVRPYRGPAVLASGHRPFFLVAGLYAALGLALWVCAYAGLLPLTMTWHGHEMVFGFAVAAISGFLMAAVPKWTGGPVIRGPLLVGLLLLWLAGRIAMAADVATWIDLLYLPVFASIILVDIVRARNVRNYQVPAMLFGLVGLNAFYHFGDPENALHAAIYLIAALIALIGGRIVPAFTQNALRLALRSDIRCTTPRWLDVLAVPSVILVVATELFLPYSPVGAVAALLAGTLLLVRMAGWQTFRTLGMPIVWILHVGYAWVPVGFLLKGIADLGYWIPHGAALHALTAGAIGTMILAVASRAALGHAGLPLVVSRGTVLAYVLVIAGAALRVLVPSGVALIAAGALWSFGYALFAVIYWPILTRPRVDGLPG